MRVSRPRCGKGNRIRKSVFNSGIEAGCHLRWVKQRLPHGQFGAWLRAELGMSERTAQNWMRVATTFEGKYETVSDLPQATVYRLAAKSTPDAVREEVASASEQGQRPDASTIEAMVRDVVLQGAQDIRKVDGAQKERRGNGSRRSPERPISATRSTRTKRSWRCRRRS